MSGPFQLVQGESYYLAVTQAVRGVPVTTTRPNNAVVYAAGQVYGPAADARIQLAVPALPADAQSDGFSAVLIFAVQSREPGAVTSPNFFYVIRNGAFTTVLGDQAPFALNDADIAALYTTNNIPTVGFGTFPTGSAAAMLNAGAGILGRRSFFFNPTLPSGRTFVPGSVVGLYVWVNGAYAPLANEFLRFRTRWTYAARAAE